MMTTLEKVRSAILKLEDAPMTLVGWVSGFLLIVMVRFFLEASSSRTLEGYLPSDIPTNLHYLLFYLSLTLLMALILNQFSRRPLRKTLNVVLFALPIIWLAPLLDFFIGSESMAYLFSGRERLLSDFLTYFGPTLPRGITLGMRLEIAIILLGTGLYVFLHARSWIRAFCTTCISYLVIFSAVALPSVLLIGGMQPQHVSVSWWDVLSRSLISLSFLHPSDQHTLIRDFELLFSGAMSQVLFLVVFALVLVIAKGIAPDVLRATIRNIRPERLGHYILLFCVGGIFALAARTVPVQWTSVDIMTITIALASIALAWVFSVVTNDLADTQIDAVSNPSRPLVSGAVTRNQTKDVALLSGALAILGAFTVGIYGGYFIAAFLAAYAVYSMPPLRLRRVPILSMFLISLACLSVVMFGFFLFSDNHHVDMFPRSLALLVILGFTLGANMKDLKDITGDRAAGIMTIPVLFGETWGRTIVGGMMFLGVMLVPMVLSRADLLFPAVVSASVLWVGVAKGRGERFIFGVYFLTVAVFLLVAFL